VLRQEYKAGEKFFVDWAATTVPIHDPRGGPVRKAHPFVAVLGGLPRPTPRPLATTVGELDRSSAVPRRRC